MVRKKKVSIRSELLRYKAQNRELLSILDDKIFSSKTYNLWQSYNQMKRRILSIISPILLIIILTTIVPIYLIFTLTIYCVSFVLAQILGTYKPLDLDSTMRKFDGVSFIIPTWNKAHLVERCVKHLDQMASQEAPSVKKEIIVVDNGSEDSTVTTLAKLQTTIPLHIVKLDKNYSFAPAINIGVEKAQYNYVYLLNNDMFVKKNFLNEIHAFASKLIARKETFFGIASQIFFFKKALRRMESGKTYYFPYFGGLYIAHCILDKTLSKPSITGYLGGGASLINKHVFTYMHKYDASLYRPLYVEDFDTSLRAWKMGFPSYFLPSSSAIHHHQSSSKSLKSKPEYFIYKNVLLLILKNVLGFRELMKHSILYPLRILIDADTVWYILNAFKDMPTIISSRVDALRYPYMLKDDSIFDFAQYEKDHTS